MISSSPRIARRREATRRRILEAAAARFATAGPEAVRMEEIAESADVARGTLYSHFPTKETLVCAVVRPVLERAHRRAEELAILDPVRGIEGLLRLYLEQWEQNPDALRLSYRMTERLPDDLRSLHDEFLGVLWRIFRRAAEQGVLRADDPILAGKIVARVAVPLLELLAHKPGGDRLFVQSVRGLLLRRRSQAPTDRSP